jgi:hypothetical protein
MYIQHNIIALSPEVQKFSATLIAWYNLNRHKAIYGNSVSPETTINNTKTYWGLHLNSPILLPDFQQICVSSTSFHKSSWYQILLKSIQWEQGWYTGAYGQRG